MENLTSKIPGKNHYSFNYSNSPRIYSYAHQIKSVLTFIPESVIEVGPGGGVVTAALRSLGIVVTTVDIQPELNPDVISSVTSLPFKDNTFQVGLCSQVLEHLPFDSFNLALRELRRVCSHALIISLPDISRIYKITIDFPILKNKSVAVQFPRRINDEFKKKRFDSMGHFWEIGFPETSLKEVTAGIVDSGWKIDKTWRVPELLWHRFFILK